MNRLIKEPLSAKNNFKEFCTILKKVKNKERLLLLEEVVMEKRDILFNLRSSPMFKII